MSHIYRKTQYATTGPYGETEMRTLYVHHNNSCDIVSFYAEDGAFLFSVEDTEKNNMMDAIDRLYCDPDTCDPLNDEDIKLIK